MKKKVAGFFILLSSSFLHSQDFEFPKLKTSTVGIEGTQIMVDQGETSVADWLSFVYNNVFLPQQEDIETVRGEMMKNLPDTNALPEKYRFMFRIFLRCIGKEKDDAGFSKHFFFGHNIVKGVVVSDMQGVYLLLSKDEVRNKIKTKLETYLSLPMVSVSFEQVQNYLQWREQMVQDDKAIKEKGYKVKARMLTTEELKKFASDLGPHSADNHSAQIDTVNKEGCYLLNIKVDNPCSSVLEGRKKFGEGAVGVFSYFPDRKGLFSIYGNVAEMTNVKGIAQGGAYNDYGTVCQAGETVEYDRPQPWLGFRCVFELSK
ncbi:MAG TPA: SUMF1/EgtB/PvdO family nonheme iron enzyme [Bacteroidia bacterium]